MRVCIFEDQGVARLEPLTLTRAVFDLWCGACSLLEWHRRHFAPEAMGAIVRPPLGAVCREAHPDLAINDEEWLASGPAVLVNARWLPPPELAQDLATPHVALLDGQLAYAVVPAASLAGCSPASIDVWVERWKADLPQRQADGWMMNYPWDLVGQNGETLCHETRFRKRETPPCRPEGLTVIGPAERLLIDPSAHVEPLTVANTTYGPVIIDRAARIKAFSYLEGPCYIGPGTWVLGAKVSMSTVGPVCRIGGEVGHSIVQGFSNKAHDGHLGDSYVGEWVNLGAGTQVSNLRTDYATIKMHIDGKWQDSGLTKVGSFIGDYTKTGINTLLNTGTSVGAFCYIFPAALLPPRVIPSFSCFARGRLEEGPGRDELLATTNAAMRRRGREVTGPAAVFIHWLHAHTAAARQQAITQSRARG
jgi:UDP-N-acetylglucosamine diphosphorylase/glucosamine-1-phosphate N-acetyltransferase